MRLATPAYQGVYKGLLVADTETALSLDDVVLFVRGLCSRFLTYTPESPVPVLLMHLGKTQWMVTNLSSHLLPYARGYSCDTWAVDVYVLPNARDEALPAHGPYSLYDYRKRCDPLYRATTSCPCILAQTAHGGLTDCAITCCQISGPLMPEPPRNTPTVRFDDAVSAWEKTLYRDNHAVAGVEFVRPSHAARRYYSVYQRRLAWCPGLVLREADIRWAQDRARDSAGSAAETRRVIETQCAACVVKDTTCASKMARTCSEAKTLESSYARFAQVGDAAWQWMVSQRSFTEPQLRFLAFSPRATYTLRKPSWGVRTTSARMSHVTSRGAFVVRAVTGRRDRTMEFDRWDQLVRHMPDLVATFRPEEWEESDEVLERMYGVCAEHLSHASFTVERDTRTEYAVEAEKISTGWGRHPRGGYFYALLHNWQSQPEKEQAALKATWHIRFMQFVCGDLYWGTV